MHGLPYALYMPFCSNWVFSAWCVTHRLWKRLIKNACSLICDHGNKWSTTLAGVMMPFALHPAHIGFLLNCIWRNACHWRVLYLALNSLRDCVLLYFWLNTRWFWPPCCKQYPFNFDLGWGHPNVAHLVLIGIVGIFKWPRFNVFPKTILTLHIATNAYLMLTHHSVQSPFVVAS